MTAEEILEFRDETSGLSLQKAEKMLRAIEPIAQKVETRLRLENSLTEFFRAAWPHFDPAPYTHGVWNPSLTTGTFSRATVAHLENSKNLDCFSTASEVSR
jgi:hypothetical protein